MKILLLLLLTQYDFSLRILNFYCIVRYKLWNFCFQRCCCSSFGDNSGLDRILQTEQMFEHIGILTKDLLHKMEPGHCYTLITDPLYVAILQSELFQEISHRSYFVINIPFNKDFLQTTEDEIIITLKEANKVGCKCYVIYLSNGNQMERFFRFINRLVIQLNKNL